MGIIDATVDGEVLCRIDGVILHRVGLDVTAVDGQCGLTLDALAAFVLALCAMHGDVAAVDGQVTLCLDAFRVGIVATLTWAGRPSATATRADGDALA